MIELIISATLNGAKISSSSITGGKILKELLKLEKEQENIFSTLKEETRIIQQSSFYAGLIYLEEASEVHRDSENQKELIKAALYEFLRAYGVQQAKTEKTTFDMNFSGFVQSYIGITYLLLNLQKDALKWIDRSLATLGNTHRLLKKDIIDLKHKLNSPKILSPGDFILNPMLIGFKAVSSPRPTVNLKKDYITRIDEYRYMRQKIKSYLEDLKKLKAHLQN